MVNLVLTSHLFPGQSVRAARKRAQTRRQGLLIPSITKHTQKSKGKTRVSLASARRAVRVTRQSKRSMIATGIARPASPREDRENTKNLLLHHQIQVNQTRVQVASLLHHLLKRNAKGTEAKAESVEERISLRNQAVITMIHIQHKTRLRS